MLGPPHACTAHDQLVKMLQPFIQPSRCSRHNDNPGVRDTACLLLDLAVCKGLKLYLPS